MQISSTGLYQSLSQYGGPSTAQTSVRAPARPVIIEGQVLDDKNSKRDSAQRPDNDSEKSQFELQDNSQTVLINSVPSSTTNNDARFQSTSQNQAADYSIINQNAGAQKNAGAEKNYSDNNAAFPYSNRRSFNGLSGSSLIVQSYLSNSPSASMQQAYAPAGVDYYI